MIALAAALVFAAFLWAPVATMVVAAPVPGQVVMVAPASNGDALIVEALNRLRAELALEGLRPVSPGGAPNGGPPAALVGMSRAAGAIIVDVKVTRPRDETPLLRQAVIAGAPEVGDASVLAIRAVELLRASLMQVAAESKADAESASLARGSAMEAGGVSRARAPSTEAARGRWRVALGGTVLQSFAGFGSAFGPTARVSLRPFSFGAPSPLGVELQVAGPTFARALTAAAGSASVRQELAAVTASWAFGGMFRLVPMASAGAGLYHVHVAGNASVGQALSNALWAPFAVAGVGVGVALGARSAVRLDAAALFVQPAPYVQIADTDAGHAGRPLVLLSLTVEGSFPRAAIP